MSFIKFDNVFYNYNAGTDLEVKALRGVSFEIQKGEFVAILGHNGSGKSTIARLANGLFLPTSGNIIVDGFNTKDRKTKFEVRKRVGLVFQNPDNQMVASIIEDDIAFGPENLGLARHEIEERVAWALDTVGMTAHRKGTPFRLSGGQKQRIAIAGVLAIKPQVLILDESTAMLDPKGRKEVLDTAISLKEKEGTSIVLITHFIEEALLADKIIIMNEGKVYSIGTKEILADSVEMEKVGLDSPFATKLADKLREKGMSLPSNIVEIEEFKKALCQR